MKKIFAIGLILFAIGIAIIPQYTACAHSGKALTLQNGNTVPMKCHWTAQAEIALAVPLGAVGVMSMFARRRESLRNLGTMGVVLGVFVMLVPASLIGVCSSAMECNIIMKPALMVLGSLTIAGSAVAVAVNSRGGKIL